MCRTSMADLAETRVDLTVLHSVRKKIYTRVSEIKFARLT